MKLYESMLVEGTSEYVVLCYSVFLVEEIELVYNQMVDCHPNIAYFKLHECEWPYSILLAEIRLREIEQVPQMVEKLMQQSFEKGSCKAAVCMLDGAFYDYDDLFSAEIANQTYAFAVNQNEPVINFDNAVRSSKSWELIVSEQKSHIL